MYRPAVGSFIWAAKGALATSMGRRRAAAVCLRVHCKIHFSHTFFFLIGNNWPLSSQNLYSFSCVFGSARSAT